MQLSSQSLKTLRLPTLAQIQAERARRDAEQRYGDAVKAVRESLVEFVRQAWPIVEPTTPLIWNWHLDVLCDALERQTHDDPEYRKLVMCVPPGMMKSLLVSVFQPSWEWLSYPGRRKIFLSGDENLAIRDSRRTREIITSSWYQSLLAHLCRDEPPWGLAYDQNQKSNFENTKRGFRQSLSMGANIMGKRANDIVIDDPIDAKDVVLGSMEQTGSRLEAIADIVEKILPPRVNDLAEARWTLIMQRLHENDTAGRAIREGGWKVINLQMEFEPENPLNHPADPRKERGELLFQRKFPAVELEKIKFKLERHYSAQYQQRPLPGDGGPLKRWYWRFWYPADALPPPPVLVQLPDGKFHECPQMPLPEDLYGHTQSWDCAFKDTKDSAYVVGEVWAEKLADSFLLDQIREKLDIVGTIDALLMLTKRWPQALKKLIEDKANGPAVIQIMRTRISGLIEVEPKGGKEARANGAAPVCRSGNVYLPHPALFAWVNGYLDETESFPVGQYADQVDSTTQYLLERYNGSPIGDMKIDTETGVQPSYWTTLGGLVSAPHLSSVSSEF